MKLRLLALAALAVMGFTVSGSVAKGDGCAAPAATACDCATSSPCCTKKVHCGTFLSKAHGCLLGSCQQCGCSTCGNSGCDRGQCGSGACGHGKCGHASLCSKRGLNIEGTEPGYNCNCAGSYKYPVPPLSTYHWPGMYSHERMTDYHSPWRFPPIKPWTEEAPYQRVTGIDGEETLVSAEGTIVSDVVSVTRRSAQPELMSSRLERLSR